MSKSNNSTIAIFAILLVAAAGVSFMVGKNSGLTESQLKKVEQQDFEVTEENPVVLRVNNEEITRVELLNQLQALPPQLRQQQPIERLFAVGQLQLINNKIIEQELEGKSFLDDEDVRQQLANAYRNIARTKFLNNAVDERLTEERVQAAYNQYKENFPKDVEEVQASHILVAEESTAKDLIKQLNEGADFAELARENSTDATASNGGQLGYLVKADVVPEFGEAAFSTEPGTYTKKPVKSQFGFHIIKIDDKRIRQPETLEEVRPRLEAQIRNVILDEYLVELRENAEIERFNLNGDPIEPAAGNEAQAVTPPAAQETPEEAVAETSNEETPQEAAN